MHPAKNQRNDIETATSKGGGRQVLSYSSGCHFFSHLLSTNIIEERSMLIIYPFHFEQIIYFPKRSSILIKIFTSNRCTQLLNLSSVGECGLFSASQIKAFPFNPTLYLTFRKHAQVLISFSTLTNISSHIMKTP